MKNIKQMVCRALAVAFLRLHLAILAAAQGAACGAAMAAKRFGINSVWGDINAVRVDIIVSVLRVTRRNDLNIQEVEHMGEKIKRLIKNPRKSLDDVIEARMILENLDDMMMGREE